MIASPQEIQALEDFFNNIPLPHQLHLNKATNLTNVEAFVSLTLKNLKNPDISETTLRPRYDDLLVIKALLQTQPQ